MAKQQGKDTETGSRWMQGKETDTRHAAMVLGGRSCKHKV